MINCRKLFVNYQKRESLGESESGKEGQCVRVS